MPRIGLIDGDSFLYKAGFSVEKTKYLVERKEGGSSLPSYVPCPDARSAAALGGYIWSRKDLGTLENALYILNTMLDNAIRRAEVDVPFTYLSPLGATFRDRLSTVRKYKNRPGSRPHYYSDLREHICRNRGAIVARDEEADDMISWVARDLKAQGKEYVIVGIDKDLVQIPGLHYDWNYDEFLDVTDDEARVWYWTQVLAGDQTDNVGGCWKFGYSKGKAFVHSCTGLSDEDVWPKVVARYKSSQKIAGCPYADRDAEEVALENARLVRLKQSQHEELWTPKTTKEEKGKKSHGRQRKSAQDQSESGSAPSAGEQEQIRTLSTE